MGFFSWKTADTDESIMNSFSEEGALAVKMIDDTGRVWIENNYEGYGDFGGQDFYGLVDIMNGGTGDRHRGIQLCDVNRSDPAPNHIKTPRLVLPGCETPWAKLPANKSCPRQGFFG